MPTARAMDLDDHGQNRASDRKLLVSFPKSGRTWLRFGLASAGLDVEVSHAGGALGKRVIGRPYREIPADLRDRPLVFLHRNPIDTAVSFYYQTTRRVLPRGSWRWVSEWLPLALSGRLAPRQIDAFVLNPLYGVHKICSFNRLWLDHLQSRGHCLIVNYDDMRADSAAGFQRILEFWNVSSVTGVQLAELASLDRMRTAEKSGQMQVRPGATSPRQKPPSDPSSAKVRRAVVNGYLDELRPETIAKCREIAAQFGFDA